MKIRHLVFLLALLGACKLLQKTVTKPEDKKIAGPKGGSVAVRSQAAFVQVLDQVDDRALRRQLEEFAQNGIGLPLDTEGTSPDAVIKTAEKYLGTPHRGGGRDRSGIDCSGLVSVAFEANGVKPFRGSSNSLARHGLVINDRRELQRGDLLFFARTYKAKDVLTHTGIYLGDGKFIHTSSSKGVVVSNLEDPTYWLPRYVFATRVFAP
jgi:murein DD-endopeptidase / murein LD-carboxypeptidase